MLRLRSFRLQSSSSQFLRLIPSPLRHRHLRGPVGHGREAWLWDSSVSDPALGSLFRPWEDSPVGHVNARIAELSGARRAFAAPCGTTGLNKLAAFTLVNPGDVVLVERDSHGSLVHALNEVGAHVYWLEPPYDPELAIALPPSPEQLERVLAGRDDFKAVFLTAPKYFGPRGNLRDLVEVCHRHGLKVLVDEAHGDGFGFHPALPISAAALGADIVTQSTHKWSEALSQGSILLLNDEELSERFLFVLNNTTTISTSFNLLIVASIEEALEHNACWGRERFDRALGLVARLRTGISGIAGLSTLDLEGYPGAGEVNPLRVAVDVSGIGLTGFEIEELLQASGGHLPPVVAELGSARHVLFLVNYGHTAEDIDLVVDRLSTIADAAPGSNRVLSLPSPPLRGLNWLPPFQAFWEVARGQTSTLPVEQAEGKVSAECIACYPPGSPVLVYGEVVTISTIRYLQQLRSFGAHLKGASDPDFRTMRVIVGKVPAGA